MRRLFTTTFGCQGPSRASTTWARTGPTSRHLCARPADSAGGAGPCPLAVISYRLRQVGTVGPS
eukprot:998194-Alexandrium_andersonii.AAC.1